jgi:hypothetical protein
VDLSVPCDFDLVVEWVRGQLLGATESCPGGPVS